MENVEFDVNNGSLSSDLQQVNTQECMQSFVHACQCCDFTCRLQECQKLKQYVSHLRFCKRRRNGCLVCKPLLTLVKLHIVDCKDAKCSVPFCPNTMMKIRQETMLQRLQETNAPYLRHQMAEIYARRIASNQASMDDGSSSMSLSSMTSLVSSMGSMVILNRGIGLKPDTQTPPANVLHVAKPVQEEAGSQHVPYCGGFGKLAPTGVQMPPPVMQHITELANQQQQQHLPMEWARNE